MLVTFDTGHQRIAVNVHDGVAHFVDFDAQRRGHCPICPEIEGPYKVQGIVMSAYASGHFSTDHTDDACALDLLGWDACVERSKATGTCLLKCAYS